MFDNLTSISPHVRSGKVRGIGVSSLKRSPIFPRHPDDRGGRRAGLRDECLGRHRGPGRHFAGDRQETQHRNQSALQAPTLKERYAAIEAEPVADQARRLRQKRDGEIGGIVGPNPARNWTDHMAANEHYDLIVRNAPSSTARARRAIAGRSACVATASSDRRTWQWPRANIEIDGVGLIAAPGFIDAHTHDDRMLLSNPDMAPKAEPGRHDGGRRQLRDQPRALARQRRAPRRRSICSTAAAAGYVSDVPRLPRRARRPARGDQRDAARRPHDVARRGDGPSRPPGDHRGDRNHARARARGARRPARSAYPPALLPARRVRADRGNHRRCAAAGRIRRTLRTHMRNEDEQRHRVDRGSVRDRRATLKVPVVISHHKMVGTRNSRPLAETLELIDARMQTQPMALDCYPYIASSTVLRYDRLRAVVAHHRHVVQAASRVRGRRSRRSRAASSACTQDGCRRDESSLPARFTSCSTSRTSQRILRYDDTMIGSDGLPHDAKPHPRLWGTFPRVLGHYCRELRLFPLETAVHKMTGLTAAQVRSRGPRRAEERAPAPTSRCSMRDTVIDTRGFPAFDTAGARHRTVIVNGARRSGAMENRAARDRAAFYCATLRFLRGLAVKNVSMPRQRCRRLPTSHILVIQRIAECVPQWRRDAATLASYTAPP